MRIKQDARRRTATINVRDNGTIPICMAGLYFLDDAPWGGAPGWLTGYGRKKGIQILNFLEVV
jgi:hypothetical protein